MDVFAQLEDELRHNFIVTVYSTYKDVVNDDNKIHVEELDRLVDQMNEKIKNLDEFSREDFVKIYNAVEKEILGNDSTALK